MAMPTVERWRNSASTSRHTGTTIIVKMSLALNVTPPKTQLASKGWGSRVPNELSPKARGGTAPAPASSWDRPMVATVSTSRGAVKNRRMIRASTSTPSSDGGDQADDQAEPVAPAPGHDQHHAEHGRQRAEVALGEVDDAVGPVDEGDAEGDERDAAADERAVEHDAHRAPGRRAAANSSSADQRHEPLQAPARPRRLEPPGAIDGGGRHRTFTPGRSVRRQRPSSAGARRSAASGGVGRGGVGVAGRAPGPQEGERHRPHLGGGLVDRQVAGGAQRLPGHGAAGHVESPGAAASRRRRRRRARGRRRGRPRRAAPGGPDAITRWSTGENGSCSSGRPSHAGGELVDVDRRAEEGVEPPVERRRRRRAAATGR